MWSIFIPASRGCIEALTTTLWEMHTTGVIEETDGLRAFFDDRVDPESVCSELAVPQVNTRAETWFDTSQVTPVECDPILIGERFFLAPSWVTQAVPQGRIRLTIDTTSAFGTGRHESTQLCLEAMEKHLKAGSFVADIGCGSGILSAAASALGAGALVSCDIHQSSVITAQTLIETPVFVGSADCLRNCLADLVLANLSLKVLDVVAADLRRITKPDGLIILSGFLQENQPRKFEPLEVSKKGDWECWVCCPKNIHAPPDAAEPAPHTQQWWL